MTYENRLKQIIDLKFDTKLVICEEGDFEVSVYRPSVPPKRFKTYDPKKNFQIWLTEQSRSFKPNHLRVMIDLHLRVRSRPDLKAELAQALDLIYYGVDPEQAVGNLQKEKFEHFLNPIMIILQLSQLFLIEQAHSYKGESKYDPKTLFYQGWVRQMIDSEREIDNLVMSVASGNSPSPTYTKQNDKKRREHNQDAQPLWWLDSETQK